jgi:histidyl-tRNA synthetase
MEHFTQLKNALDLFDLQYEINPKMVRGLDYYAKTTFEVITEHLGAQNAVVGGGRYDGLIKYLGGPDIPGIGFAVGCERLISLSPVKEEDFFILPSLFIAALGDEAQKLAFTLCNQLRLNGIQSEMDYSAKSLKSQMKRADKLKCNYTLILGEKEIMEKKAELRDMRKGTQENISFDNIEENIIKIVKGS